MEKKARYTEGSGRYESLSPIRYDTVLAGTSILNETEQARKAFFKVL